MELWVLILACILDNLLKLHNEKILIVKWYFFFFVIKLSYIIVHTKPCIFKSRQVATIQSPTSTLIPLSNKACILAVGNKVLILVNFSLVDNKPIEANALKQGGLTQ